ncbi:hypothetical protein M422DRAFT_256491 [Sphaerobolus stellatus SS14]|uniref:Cytochrome P450 n=1 Tax=Sphaerobolus stellatus (strain SS14) TaxID=990650 RepID=A0A0C9VQL8_SPHS4|nr:hypothetical protein M422DRAFT_256491 [Sphaerobolus stellatus SS14]
MFSLFDQATTRYWHYIPAAFVIYRILHQLFLKPLILSPLKRVSGPSLGHPIFGQFLNILTSEPGKLQRKWAEQYGTVVRTMGPFGVDQMMFLNPSALQRILVSDWLEYPRPDPLRHILGATAGYGLLTVTGNEHKLMRRTMSPAFSLSNLMAQTDMYYPPLEGLIQILHKYIKSESDPSKGTEILVYDWISKVTLDIICATAFGYHPDSVHKDDNELSSAYHGLINLQTGQNMVLFAILMMIPGFPKFIRTRFAHKYRKLIFRGSMLAPLATLVSSMNKIMAISRQMLDEKLQEADVKDSQSKKDIMSLLVRVRITETGNAYKMTDQDLMEQVLTFLGAGHETNTSGISWTLWLLAAHPEYQTRLREELLPVIEANPRPNHRTLKELTLLDGIIMESLRLLPPVPLTFRRSAKDNSIDGNFIPKGSLLSIPIRVINTYYEIWGPDAQEFRPERWSNLPSTYNFTFSFSSFIAGPHSCIGRTMAIMEMKVIIAGLIAHFSFERAYEGQVARPTAAITMKPEDNLPLRIKAIGKLPIPTEVC